MPTEYPARIPRPGEATLAPGARADLVVSNTERGDDVIASA